MFLPSRESLFLLLLESIVLFGCGNGPLLLYWLQQNINCNLCICNTINWWTNVKKMIYPCWHVDPLAHCSDYTLSSVYLTVYKTNVVLIGLTMPLIHYCPGHYSSYRLGCEKADHPNETEKHCFIFQCDFAQY